MMAVLEGLLYVQGDLGLTIEQVVDILEIDKEEAKKLVYELKQSYENDNRGLRINYLGNTFKLYIYLKHIIDNIKTIIVKNNFIMFFNFILLPHHTIKILIILIIYHIIKV